MGQKPIPTTMYIIIYGNPVNGFKYVGPFRDRDETITWADNNHGRLEGDWWTVELQPISHKAYHVCQD